MKKLKSLYKDINNIDLWVGGLGEDHVEGSELGETFHTIIVKQFTRIRDGDRFWYKNILTKEVRIPHIHQIIFEQLIAGVSTDDNA